MGRELEGKVRYRCVSSQLAGKDGEMLNDHERDGTAEEENPCVKEKQLDSVRSWSQTG